MSMLLDAYAISPELNHLRNAGVAQVWQYETNRPKREGIGPLLFQSDWAIISLNRQQLDDILSYRLLADNWDEEDAIAPTEYTVQAAFGIAFLLTVTGHKVYHTSPGPNGEIMINLRNGDKSVELLFYPSYRNKFVRIGLSEIPLQGMLTPNSLKENLHWLNS